jgi:serine/threonine-protein kinase HipA
MVRDNIYKDFRRNADKVKELIDHSFLTDDFKEKYVQIVHTKLK